VFGAQMFGGSGSGGVESNPASNFFNSQQVTKKETQV
jgi:hypothetical protein